MKKIRVLYVIDSLSVGGAEKLLLNLVSHMDHTRFEFYVCCIKVLRGNALAEQFNKLGVPVHVVNAKHLYDPRVFLNIAQYIHRHNIDIIHTHLQYADIIGGIVGFIMRRPVVSTLHNVPMAYDKQRFDRRILTRLVARHLTKVLVPVAPRVSELFAGEWGIPKDRFQTICNGVQVTDYIDIPARRPQRNASSGPVITNIGRLTPQKGQLHLLEAAKLVLEHHPNARFMIVGQGHLHPKLIQRAEALGIVDQVTFAGVRHDIPNILAESDIFVLSSLWEGLPLTAMEAMAAACPVVLTDVGSNSELAKTGVHGLIVPPNDVQALANALLELLEDEERRVTMGLAARERVQQNFNVETLADQHGLLYERIYNKHRMALSKLFLSARR